MIRYVCDKDVEQILNIYNYYILNTTITFEIDAYDLDTFKNKVNKISSEYPYIVYEENNKILGYAYLDHFNPRKAYDITADLTIYLDKDVKSKGIGTALYKEIEALGKKKGIKKLVSLVTSDNEISKKFHLKMGFEHLMDLDECAYKFNEILGVTFYVKNI